LIYEGHYYVYFLLQYPLEKYNYGSGKAWKTPGISSPTLRPPCNIKQFEVCGTFAFSVVIWYYAYKRRNIYHSGLLLVEFVDMELLSWKCRISVW